MYSDAQIRSIAYELARAGGNVEAAARALRGEYETFRKVSATTIRRARAEKAFPALYREFTREFTAALREAEAERAERDARAACESSRQRDEKILTRVQDRALGAGVLTQLKPAQVAHYHTALVGVLERRRLAREALAVRRAERKSGVRRPTSGVTGPSIEK